MTRKIRGKKRCCWGLIPLALLLCGLMLVPDMPRAMAGPAMIGEEGRYRVRAGDTLLDIAVSHKLGFAALLLANPGVDPWIPTPGTRLLLPQRHLLPAAEASGIVINLPELRLYYFLPEGSGVLSFPIGTGRLEHETPTGQTSVVKKRVDPSWIPTASARKDDPGLPEIVPPGPQNPLGAHALNLGWPRYIIHGTNRPYGIGRRVSRGCIRLYPADIATLFAAVEVGTPVTILDQPVKTAWVDGELYLEVHPSAIQLDALLATGRLTPYNPPETAKIVLEAAQEQAARLNWSVIRQATQERRGIPVRITMPNMN